MQMFRLTRRKLSCQKKRTWKLQKQQGLHPRRVPSAHSTTEGREKERRNQKPNSERNADPDGITVPVMTVPKTSSENQVGKIFLISRPVPNYFLSRVHIPHNYNAHPVHSFQWICKTLRQISNQFDNCVMRAHHHLLIWRNLSRGKTWKHWQMLPSQTLMKIEKVVLVLAKRWECFVYIENRKSWPYCYFNLLRPVFNLFVKLKRARIVYEKWSARIHYSKQEEKKRR